MDHISSLGSNYAWENCFIMQATIPVHVNHRIENQYIISNSLIT